MVEDTHVMTKRLTCDCVHEVQDKMFGKGIRLHNRCPRPTGLDDVWRCTVCKKERSK